MTKTLEMKTICQMCGKKGLCRIVNCNTSHLHNVRGKITGHQGKAALSVCYKCEIKYNK